MNNLSSYCGLVDEKIRASDKDLPVMASNLLPLGLVSVLFLPAIASKQNLGLPDE